MQPQNYPESVLPYYRKQRAYLNQAIARNEVDAKEEISRKLFFRVARGFYVLNPELEILRKEDWVSVYDMMGAEKAEKFDQEEYFRLKREEMLKAFSHFREMMGNKF